jgi:lysozyme family protein
MALSSVGPCDGVAVLQSATAEATTAAVEGGIGAAVTVTALGLLVGWYVLQNRRG